MFSLTGPVDFAASAVTVAVQVESATRVLFLYLTDGRGWTRAEETCNTDAFRSRYKPQEYVAGQVRATVWCVAYRSLHLRIGHGLRCGRGLTESIA